MMRKEAPTEPGFSCSSLDNENGENGGIKIKRKFRRRDKMGAMTDMNRGKKLKGKDEK